jgi:alpha-tubulin suppressor-like RCC1 family protein
VPGPPAGQLGWRIESELKAGSSTLGSSQQPSRRSLLVSSQTSIAATTTDPRARGASSRPPGSGRDRRSRPSAYAWGHNNLGGLGIGNTARAHKPVRADVVPRDAVDVQGGTDFSVALTAAGEVWTWGGNGRGQLGDGTRTARRGAARVKLPRVSAVAVGERHVLAVTRRGELFGWGDNSHAQIGGQSVDQAEPARIASVGHGARVAAGNACSIAIDPHGETRVWGRPFQGLTEDLAADLAFARAALLPTSVKVKQVDAGQRHLVALTARGELLGFGSDPAGQPARERFRTERSWGRVIEISAGDDHTVALTNRGVVLTWGRNNHGQLGVGDTLMRAEPVGVRLPRLRGRVVTVAAAGDFTLALTDRHQVYLWGHGAFGQNGNGATDDQLRPAPLQLPRDVDVASIHAGRFHALVLTRSHR